MEVWVLVSGDVIRAIKCRQLKNEDAVGRLVSNVDVQDRESGLKLEGKKSCTDTGS
jgi:hypothetical protein